MTHPIFYNIAKKFPDLKLKLRQAEMHKESYDFVKQTCVSSLYVSAGIFISLFLMFSKHNKSAVLFLILGFPILFFIMFLYLLKLPDAKIIKISKEIDKEILFAGEFMIIELKSGVTLYQVLKNIANNYGGIGRYFKRIIQDVDLGTEIQLAINNSIRENPSDSYRKVMWQLSNSITTGADITISLGTVLDQISKSQMTEVEKYGKKLNPIATFYLMLAVIIPSLGMVMVIVAASILNFKISLLGFIFIALFFMFFQFMFYAVIQSNRPAVEM